MASEDQDYAMEEVETEFSEYTQEVYDAVSTSYQEITSSFSVALTSLSKVVTVVHYSYSEDRGINKKGLNILQQMKTSFQSVQKRVTLDLQILEEKYQKVCS
jgi:predicted DNA-binding ArsR family transcriptional regulator